MRLQEDCNYRLKWQIEDMQQRWTTRTSSIQTLTKETGMLRDRGSSTGPDLNAASGAAFSAVGRPRQRSAQLPPAPGSLDVQPGREFSPSGRRRVARRRRRQIPGLHVDRLAARSRVSPASFTAPAGRKPLCRRIASIRMPKSNELF